MPAVFKVYASEDGVWSQVKVFDSLNDEQEARAFAVDLTRDGQFERSMVVERGSDRSANGVAYHLKYKAEKGANRPEATRPSAEGRSEPAPLVLPVQKGLTGEWVIVGPQIAKRHKLYGVYGWLAYLAFTLAIGPVVGIADILIGGGDTSEQSPFVLAFAVLLLCVFYWFPLYLLRKREAGFPTTMVILFTILLLLDIAILAFPQAGLNALTIGYVLISKRVNVTFKHRVRREDLQWLIAEKQRPGVQFVSAKDVATNRT